MKKVLLVVSLVFMSQVQAAQWQQFEDYEVSFVDGSAGYDPSGPSQLQGAKNNNGLPRKWVVGGDVKIWDRSSSVDRNAISLFYYDQTDRSKKYLVCSQDFKSKLPSGLVLNRHHNGSFSYEVTTIVNALPALVCFPEGCLIEGASIVHPAKFTANVIEAANTGDIGMAKALVNVLQGEKRVQFLRRIEPLIQPSQFNKLVDAGGWDEALADIKNAIAEAISERTQQLKDGAQELKKGVASAINEVPKVANGVFDSIKISAEKKIGPWKGGMVLGSFVTFMVMYFAFIRNK